TGDRTGTRTGDRGLENEELYSRLETLNWDTTFRQFRGEIMQTPPMYSAKKVEGTKLYELARRGIEIERQSVPVTIHKLELVNGGESSEPPNALCVRVSCSAGTYIRTLAEDIGRAVGVGAHLEELRRTRAGRFAIDRAVTLEELEGSADPMARLIPMDEAVTHLPEVLLSEERALKTKNGMSSRIFDSQFLDGEAIRMAGPNGELIAIGEYSEGDKSVQPKVVLS
ncbi:MAG: tRNA pseudouridine(55) synthase TruB, partial [Acidobacteriota bacterium]